VYDTDGDGDCAACARNPEALCRVPVPNGWTELGMTSPTDDYSKWAREWTQRYGGAEEPRPTPDILISSERTKIHQESIRINDQAKPVTYDEVVELLSRVSREPWRDSMSNTPDEMRGWNLAIHPLTHVPVPYHRRPREFMQCEGGGLPYNTHNPWHFQMRYGMPYRPGIRVGIRRRTPRLMAEHQASEKAAMDAIRLLS